MLAPITLITLLSMKHRIQLTLAVIALAGFATAANAAPVAENWENHCTKCHGDDGKGKTKAGRKLDVKDYTDAKVQAEMKEDTMTKAIIDGIFEKGKERMKAYKDELSADEIKELVAYVRKFKK